MIISRVGVNVLCIFSTFCMLIVEWREIVFRVIILPFISG